MNPRGVKKNQSTVDFKLTTNCYSLFIYRIWISFFKDGPRSGSVRLGSDSEPSSAGVFRYYLLEGGGGGKVASFLR